MKMVVRNINLKFLLNKKLTKKEEKCIGVLNFLNNFKIIKSKLFFYEEWLYFHTKENVILFEYVVTDEYLYMSRRVYSNLYLKYKLEKDIIFEIVKCFMKSKFNLSCIDIDSEFSIGDMEGDESDLCNKKYIKI